ncbi:MAG: hypothetical protein Q9Q13_03460 [Acidobacteriota bacterium]|nr:hypothetical protein [Acidobacteriota bacterium]
MMRYMVCGLLWALAGLLPALAAEDPLTATYIHGITPETARRAVGAEAGERLLAALADPTFPRRDNIVAFLAHLGGPQATGALARLLTDPPADPRRPEEERALLLAPQALGRIAARGDSHALDLLLRMTAATPDESLLASSRRFETPTDWRDALIEAAVRGLGWSGLPAARNRVSDIALGRLVPGGMSRDPAEAALAALELLKSVERSGVLPTPSVAAGPRATGDGWGEIDPGGAPPPRREPRPSTPPVACTATTSPTPIMSASRIPWTTAASTRSSRRPPSAPAGPTTRETWAAASPWPARATPGASAAPVTGWT